MTRKAQEKALDCAENAPARRHGYDTWWKLTLTVAVLSVLPFVAGAVIGPDWLFYAGFCGLMVALLMCVAVFLWKLWGTR